MTAEIAVLNRQAVALAADSAVTVSGPSGLKVYNSVNKLFTLSRVAPIGVMIYGNAELTGVPWETIIKVYRRQLGETRFPRLSMYAEDFLRFLNRRNSLFPELQQQHQLLSSTYVLFTLLLSGIDSAINEALESGPIDRRRVATICRVEVDRFHENWAKASFLRGRSAVFVQTVQKRWASEIDSAIRAVFKNLPIGPATKRKLRELPGLLFAKALFPPTVSGIVIAGFGEDEHYPSLVSYDMEGVVLDRLKFESRQSHVVQSGDDVAIMPFAQREMVHLFMEGVDPRFREVIRTALGDFTTGLPDAMVDGLPISANAKRLAKRQIQQASRELLTAFWDRVDQHSQQRHISPIVQSVALLPKDELAAMAESLVNLTSFKRRVTMDVETVGGPVDVAVISKGDGFIWIKRKHYFDPELNHHFFSNYYN